MAATVSNNELTVATTDSGHLAKTHGPTDAHWDLAKKVVAPFENYVDTKLSKNPTTSQTKIKGAMVVIKTTIIGPPSDPAHDPFQPGLVSGTYRATAAMVCGSTDVKAEGAPIQRYTDPTTQNFANTTGSIMDSDLTQSLSLEAYKNKQRCKLDHIKVNCSHRSALPDDAFLEVFQGDTITITATRVNAVEAGKGPTCPPGDLTVFVVTRTGGFNFISTSPGPWPKKGPEEFSGKDVLTLGEDWLGPEPGEGKQEAETKKQTKTTITNTRTGDATSWTNNKGETVQGRAAYDKSQLTTLATAKEIPKPFKQQDDKHYEVEPSLGAKKPEKTAKQAALAQLPGDIFTLVKLVTAKFDPITINVAMAACSGGKSYQIRAYPPGEFNFDLMGSELAQTLMKFKGYARVWQTIADALGHKIEVQFLEAPTAKLKAQYKELAEDKNNHKKREVRMKWELQLAFSPVVAIAFEFDFPILNLFGALGGAANVALTALGVEAVLFVKAGISIALTLAAAIDEYGLPEASVSATVTPDFQLGAKIQIRDNAELSICCDMTCDITIKRARSSEKKWAELCIEPGQLKIGIKGSLKANIWGFKDGRGFDYYPPSWAMKWNEFWLNVLGFLPSG